jgi:hypothetical protein
MAKDLQAKIQSLGQRLKEEYNSKSPELLDTESEKTKPPTRALLGLNIGSGTRKQRPGIHLRNCIMAPTVGHFVPEIELVSYLSCDYCCHPYS